MYNMAEKKPGGDIFIDKLLKAMNCKHLMKILR